MKTWVKYSVLGVGCFAFGAAAAGLIASRLVSSHLQSSVGHAMYHDFESSFGRLASRDGAPRSPEAIQENEKAKLGLSTIVLGQEFDRIGDPQLRAEAVRIATLISANPRLQRPTTNATAREAAEARRCIIENASRPPEVVQCVRESMIKAEGGNSIASSR